MKALSTIVLFGILLFNNVVAQVILPLGLGQKNSLNITCSYQNKLWVVSDEGTNFAINKWDGNFWIQYKNIPESMLSTISASYQFIEAKAIYYHNDQLYLALANTQNGKLLLIKNSNNNWELINTDKISIEGQLTFIPSADTLLLCGKITVDALPKSILIINKSDCEVYAGVFANQSISPEYKDFEINGNKIWSIGIFSSITDPDKHFAVLENKVWKTVENPPFKNGFDAFGKFNNSLVAAGSDNDGVKSFSLQDKADPANWFEISNGLVDWEIISISDFHQVGTNLWAAGKFFNKTANQLASLAFWNGTIWAIPQFDYIGDDIKLNGTDEALISGKFFNHQGLLLNKTGKLSFGFAIIAGKVFYDFNQNCTQDVGENPIQGVVLKLITEDIFAISDFNGRYYFPIDLNTSIHAIELQTPLYHSATCNSTIGVKHTKELTVAGIDFGIIPRVGHSDLAVSINDFTGWRARQGFNERYKLCVTNKGTEKTETGKLIFISDNRILNWDFSDSPVSSQANIYEWNLNSLAIGQTYCVIGKAPIPMQVALGEKLNFEAKITFNADENLSDNQTNLKQSVVAAIDPNDKCTKQDNIIAPTTGQLDYKIRFQNTGNDTAYSITVTDEIDPNLRITSKGIFNSCSHLYESAPTWWIGADGKYRYKLAWKFSDILLADINTNEAESHGFINFTLYIKPALSLGTVIKNKAYIYFDYQEPIVTNTAKNLVSLEGRIKTAVDKTKLNIYPNPASDILNISNKFGTDIKLNLINSLGQTIFTKNLAPGSDLIIDTALLPKGLYIIKAEGCAAYKVVLN